MADAAQLQFLEPARELEGTVETIVYQDSVSPYMVARVRTGHRTVAVVGETEAPEVGKEYRFVGEWTHHKQYGEQFTTHWYEERLPSTARGIERYLASAKIGGIGKGLARRLVEHFGDDTLRVIQENPERLAEVPRLRPEVQARLIEAMREHQAVRQVMVFLAGFDITPKLAGRIYRAFGSACMEVVRRNPYRMAEEIRGVGFKTADSVARRLGRPLDDPFRLQAGLLHALREATDDGHFFLPREPLLEKAADLLECSAAELADVLEKAVAAGKVVVEEDAVYLRALHRLECRIAERLLGRLDRTGHPPPDEERIDAIETELGITLAVQQRECLRQALASGMFIMTGGPGTGKTTTVRSLLAWCDMLELSVDLAAPTGRAARRMAEATGREARTLHRMLEYSPNEGGFARGADRPLKADVVIVDEASMVDGFLFSALLEALPSDASLILVGDVDQLPSVGAGCVLRDLIDSGRVPAVFLNEIFRQAEGSLIVRNAHRINQGEMPLPGTADGDYFFIAAEDGVADLVVDLCTRRLPEYYGLNPIEDVQVISPMYRGDAGVTHLNARLQERLNPAAGQGVPVSNGRAYVGDKVMQMRNNYERGVFNGDMGIVTGVDTAEDVLLVRLLGSSTASDDAIEYPFEEAGELALAYACSVHKSQGSEFPAVVIALTTQHFVMLQRNLLYTAITRARRLVVVVGSRRAMGIAVKNDRVERRYTGLAARLRGELPTS